MSGTHPFVRGFGAPSVISRVIAMSVCLAWVGVVEAQVAQVRVTWSESLGVRSAQFVQCGPWGCRPSPCGPQGCFLPAPSPDARPLPLPRNEQVQHRAKGTCVCIGRAGDKSMFIAAGHVIGSGRSATIEVSQGGAWRPAIVAAVSETIDLAVLEVQTSSADVFEVAEHVPPANTAVTVVGFPGGGPYRVRETTVAGHGPGVIWMAMAIQDGDSGGAVLQDGRLVGLAVATASDGAANSVAVDAPTISAWLRSLGRAPTSDHGPRPDPQTTSSTGSPGPPGDRGPPGPPGKDADLTAMSQLNERVSRLEQSLVELRATETRVVTRLPNGDEFHAESVRILAGEPVEFRLVEGDAHDEEARGTIQRIEQSLKTLRTPIRIWDLHSGKMVSSGSAKIYAGEPIDIRLGGATVLRPRKAEE